MENNLGRRSFLKYSSLAVVSCFTGASYSSFKQPKITKKPNIVFIMSDDHAVSAIGCYGSKINKTPKIDKLAKEGMRFDNCFCVNSICAPSRAAILTGKYGHANGVTTNRSKFDWSQKTFPKILREAGYQTALIGKLHLQSGQKWENVNPAGFDHYSVLIQGWGQGYYGNPIFRTDGKNRKTKGYVTNIITDQSIDWIKNRDKTKPFCLLLHHKAPHRSFRADKKHSQMFEDVDIPTPETFNDDYKTRENTAGDTKITIKDGLVEADVQKPIPEDLSGQELKNWKYQHFIKNYLRTVASIDDNVGRMLEFLEQEKLSEDTIVVYTSDQGFFLGEHGLFDKRFMYEESIRMPFIVRYPKLIKPGSVNQDFVLNLDFGPTFLDLCGAQIPSDIHGLSIKPLLQGTTPDDWRTSIYYHYYEDAWGVKPHYGIRTQRYKLIHFYHDVDIWELYDLKNDPNELINVYLHPDYQDVVAELKEELKSLKKKYSYSDELVQKSHKEG